MTRPLGLATTRVLAALREDPRYGLDIVDATGLASGTVYPTLGQLEKRGLVRGRWEDPALAVEEGRPRRRYYELTDHGREALDRALRHFRDLGRTARELGEGRLAGEGCPWVSPAGPRTASRAGPAGGFVRCRWWCPAGAGRGGAGNGRPSCSSSVAERRGT